MRSNAYIANVCKCMQMYANVWHFLQPNVIQMAPFTNNDAMFACSVDVRSSTNRFLWQCLWWIKKCMTVNMFIKLRHQNHGTINMEILQQSFNIFLCYETSLDNGVVLLWHWHSSSQTSGIFRDDVPHSKETISNEHWIRIFTLRRLLDHHFFRHCIQSLYGERTRIERTIFQLKTWNESNSFKMWIFRVGIGTIVSNTL
jgi:hypothetical protein